MDIKKLVSAIAKKEGKKSQVKVGDVREIVGILSDMVYQEWVKNNSIAIEQTLFTNGRRRSKKKA